MSTLRLDTEEVRRALDNLDGSGECICGGSIAAPCQHCIAQEGLEALETLNQHLRKVQQVMVNIDRTAPLVRIEDHSKIREWLAERQ